MVTLANIGQHQGNWVLLEQAYRNFVHRKLPQANTINRWRAEIAAE